MKEIIVNNRHFKELNNEVRNTTDKDITLVGVSGQRFIAAGLKDKNIKIKGVPGNALASYLDGCNIEVFSSAQDATGDTMNDGTIIIHGSVGDACGYAMRGGKIYVKGSAGYRSGIHMKAYKDKQPLLIIGDSAGSFLGEYQAGGTIIVLGLNQEGKAPVGYFCGTGMHGGKIFLRCNEPPKDLPVQVLCQKADKKDKEEILEKIKEYCGIFGLDSDSLIKDTFYTLTANSKNPYKQLYTHI